MRILESSDPLKIGSQLRTDELNRRLDQLWIGIWIATISVLISTFIFRRLSGNPVQPISIIIQITLNGIVIANILLFRTRYARLAQGVFVFIIHLAVPPVMILFGGTRGFGDVAFFMTILVTMLYGWQWWMFLTYGGMGLTVLWVLYLDSIGQPIAPLLDYSAQFTSVKFIVTTLVMVFVIRSIRSFYDSLLETYRSFAEEQLRLNDELMESELTLAQVNENLKRSRQKIITAREEERRRLRRDLHDGLGPSLAAQMFRIGVARQVLPRDPEKTIDILTDVESGIDTTLSDVRRLVYGLRPPLLDQFGLLGALNASVQQLGEQIAIELDLSEEPPAVNAAVEVAIFLIFQTALDNVIKHAQATRCWVCLSADPQQIKLAIRDNGCGLSPDQPYGVGLTSIKERAEELGGSFKVQVLEPRGTEVSVTIPLL